MNASIHWIFLLNKENNSIYNSKFKKLIVNDNNMVKFIKIKIN